MAEQTRIEADVLASGSVKKTQETVALSYDRLAQDIEKRLVNRLYRNGPFVG